MVRTSSHGLVELQLMHCSIESCEAVENDSDAHPRPLTSGQFNPDYSVKTFQICIELNLTS